VHQLTSGGRDFGRYPTNSYTFTKIADNSSFFIDRSGVPLNDSGVVAFVGGLNNGEEILLTGSGGSLSTIFINPLFEDRNLLSLEVLRSTTMEL
jgi:hypothetical protein